MTITHKAINLIFSLCLLSPVAASAQSTEAFPYPCVPDTLLTPETRATYVVCHYWDNYDFSDTTLIHRPEIAEQGFANFVDLLPRVPASTAAKGITAFADLLYSVGNDETSKSKVTDYFSLLIEKYLGDADSPLHSELLYAEFIDVMSANKFASLAERTRNTYMARNLKKNLPGSVAANFVYIDRQGASHHLHDVKSEYTLLVFYDPDCDHCHDICDQLMQMKSIIENTQIKVLAIYPYSDTEAWRLSNPSFPESWTDGYSPKGAITTDDIYYIKSVPSIYLLDANKHVLLKNASIKQIQDYWRK